MHVVESLNIQPTAPFTLRVLSSRLKLARSTEFHLLEDQSLLAVFHLPGKEPNVLHVTEKGSTNAPLLLVQRYARQEGPRPDVVARLTQVLSLSVPISSFYARLRDSGPMAKLAQTKRGLRPVCEPNLFAAVVKTVVGQQLNTLFAGTLVQRLVGLAGTQVTVAKETLGLFPSPAAVAALSYQDLQALQFSRRKAEYIIDFAAAVSDGTFDLEGLASLEDEEVVRRFQALRGFGRWSAENILIFGLARPDVFPVGDVGVLNGLRELYQLPQRPTSEVALAIAQQWRPYRSTATFYLWESLSD